MSISATYMHTNLIAEDWRSLAKFYQDVFGCIPLPPERDFKGSDFDAGTGLAGAHLTGVHLRLPGFSGVAPTLENFHYDVLRTRPTIAVNRPGFGHIAFSVDDVPSARQTVLQAGGHQVGDIVTLPRLRSFGITRNRRVLRGDKIKGRHAKDE